MDTAHPAGRTGDAPPGSLATAWARHAARLSEVVRRRVPPVLAAVLDAADILQAAYPDAGRRWDAFRARGEEPAGSEYAWLYGIVMARLVEEYRRHTRGVRDRRRDLPWPEASSVQLGLSLVAGGDSPSEEAARADSRVRMRQALDQLPDADREILWMRHFDELTFAEAAAVLGIGANAAAQRYVRALRKLRKLREVWKALEPADRSGLRPPGATRCWATYSPHWSGPSRRTASGSSPSSPPATRTSPATWPGCSTPPAGSATPGPPIRPRRAGSNRGSGSGRSRSAG
jgi:RNA polymerase sigma-70 factor (ECF subfamily)